MRYWRRGVRYWRAPYFPHTRAPYFPSRDEQNRFLFVISYLSDKISTKFVRQIVRQICSDKQQILFEQTQILLFVRQNDFRQRICPTNNFGKFVFVRQKNVLCEQNLLLSEQICPTNCLTNDVFLLFVPTNNKFCYLLFVICSLCQQIC